METHQAKADKGNNNVCRVCGGSCHLCGTVSLSPKIHLFESRGIKDQYKIDADGAHCLICSKIFHTQKSMVNHIRYDYPKCRALIVDLGPRLTLEAANNLDAAEIGIEPYMLGPKHAQRLRSIALDFRAHYCMCVLSPTACLKEMLAIISE